MNGCEKEKSFIISRFASDRRFPDVMYALTVRENTGNKLFRSVTGGETWENISEGFLNEACSAIEVPPVTGEVFIGGGNGSRVMLPPYKANNTAYELVKYKNTFIDIPY